MKDIAIDENLEILLGSRNDLEVVEGQAQFEQSLSLWLTEFFASEVGSANSQDVIGRIRLQVERVARLSGRIDTIAAFSVEPSEDIPDSLDVSIVYLTGETFDLTL